MKRGQISEEAAREAIEKISDIPIGSLISITCDCSYCAELETFKVLGKDREGYFFIECPECGTRLRCETDQPGYDSPVFHGMRSEFAEELGRVLAGQHQVIKSMTINRVFPLVGIAGLSLVVTAITRSRDLAYLSLLFLGFFILAQMRVLYLGFNSIFLLGRTKSEPLDLNDEKKPLFFVMALSVFSVILLLGSAWLANENMVFLALGLLVLAAPVAVFANIVSASNLEKLSEISLGIANKNDEL